MRSDLRLRDLRGPRRGVTKLMNIKVPTVVNEEIQRVARELKASKTDVVIALLNEGLDSASGALKGWKTPKVKLPPPKRTCTIRGCERAYVAKGYCATHYQAFRRGQLP